MNMRMLSKKIGQRPFDGAKIIGQQQIGTPFLQLVPEQNNIFPRRTLGKFQSVQIIFDTSLEFFRAVIHAIHGDNRMAVFFTPVIGECNCSGLCAAYGKTWEYMQQINWGHDLIHTESINVKKD